MPIIESPFTRKMKVASLLRITALVQSLETEAQEAITLKSDLEALRGKHQTLQVTLKSAENRAKGAEKDRQEINRLIRSRVLAHLRAEDEAEMIAQSRRVEFIETAGEIGALLLEARLIKQQSPLFNIRLRRLRNLCSIRIIEKSGVVSPEIVSGKNVAVGQADDLYGLFSSVYSAQSKLRELADQHSLCLGLLGIEKISKRGCFGLQVKTCLGACVGKEDRHEHDQRLFTALSRHHWPMIKSMSPSNMLRSNVLRTV